MNQFKEEKKGNTFLEFEHSFADSDSDDIDALTAVSKNDRPLIEVLET